MKRNRRRGQTIVEYVLIIAIVVVAAIGILGVFSDTIRGKLAGIVNVFGGDAAAASAATADNSATIMKNLQPDGTISGG